MPRAEDALTCSRGRWRAGRGCPSTRCDGCASAPRGSTPSSSAESFAYSMQRSGRAGRHTGDDAGPQRHGRSRRPRTRPATSSGCRPLRKRLVRTHRWRREKYGYYEPRQADRGVLPRMPSPHYEWRFDARYPRFACRLRRHVRQALRPDPRRVGVRRHSCRRSSNAADSRRGHRRAADANGQPRHAAGDRDRVLASAAPRPRRRSSSSTHRHDARTAACSARASASAAARRSC